MSNENQNSILQQSNEIIEKLLFETLKEQRRKRRWGIFFKLVFLAIVVFILISAIPWDNFSEKVDHKKHIAEVDIYDEIATDTPSNGTDIIQALDDAANDEKTQAIILDIDSPGGSPVQASYVYNEINRLRAKNKDLPIYAVCEDMCASAAYYIASASDKIYANPLSIVGSIGVLMDEFGFVDTMQKVGVTRRLFTAGAHKGMLDPFSPLKPDDVKIVQHMLDEDHQIFINDVLKGRGKRLKVEQDTFSGLAWNGQDALPMGLIDGFGSMNDVARNVFKNDNIVNFTVNHSFLDVLSDKLGASFFHKIVGEATKPKLS